MPARPSSLPRPESPERFPWRLLLHVQERETPRPFIPTEEAAPILGVEVKDVMILGRPDDEFNPDIDLSPYDAQGAVSRRHAQITRFEQFLYIEDLASTNGTHINGYLLEPLRRYRLRDGDQMTLGSIRLVVRFVSAPLSASAGAT